MRWRSGAAATSALLIGLGFFGWHRLTAPNCSLSFSELPGRVESLVCSPQSPLARFESFPFCSADFELQSEGEPCLEALLPKRSRLSFYLQDLLSVQLTVEARFSDHSQQEVRWQVNGFPWRQGRLSDHWQTFSAEVPVEMLQIGKNRLSLEMDLGQRTQFRKFQVTPLMRPVQDPTLGPDCHLPLAANLALVVDSSGQSYLNFEALQEDLSPGAPAQDKPGLRLSLRGPNLQWNRVCVPTSSPQRIFLPRSSSGSAKLQMMAVAQGTPLPGQFGLILKEPRLEVRRHEQPVQSKPVLPTRLPPAIRPNVILYLIDTLRADHLGCYGYTPSPSPYLDEFAKDSVVFRDASAQSGWTKPSTASILSSQWPWRHGAQDFADKLPATVPLLPEILQTGGYTTAAVVTNNLAGPDFGFERGYHTFEMRAKATSEEAHDLAQRWLEKQSGKQPFFLNVHTIDPHSPYMHSSQNQGKSRADAEQSDDEARQLTGQACTNRMRGQDNQSLRPRLAAVMAQYDHEIACNDASFGRLIGWLKSHQMYDQTMIVVVSDHGEEFLEHGQVGHVSSLYQELLHVPLIIKFPQQQGAGRQVQEVWQHIDIAPTILRTCGFPQPKSFQGMAYACERATLGQQRPALFSVQAGRDVLKLHPRDKPLFISIRGIRQGPWVYHQVTSGAAGRFEPEELYNLEQDPGQQRNQAWIDPAICLKMACSLDLVFRGPVRAAEKTSESAQQLLQQLRSLQYVR